MNYSVFEVFRIGIGPSSSHTVGPMSVAYRYITTLKQQSLLQKVTTLNIHLYGSLALTGLGHGTDTAVLAGLMGEQPDTIDPRSLSPRVENVQQTSKLKLAGEHEITFDYLNNLLFHRSVTLPEHPNGMMLEAFDGSGALLYQNTYFSIGGGAVLDSAEFAASKRAGGTVNDAVNAPHRFTCANDLLRMGAENQLSIADMVWQNELNYQDAETTRKRLLALWEVMNDCVERGLHGEGFLPGHLNVKRRAPSLYKQSSVFGGKLTADFQAMDIVSAFAIAVNEENACGGRVVTAPTNGSAGVIPAVLGYYTRFCRTPAEAKEDDIIKFLLTAAGIGMLYKKNASISAAEMGCQGEIGVSCSMAAAGLAAVLGASNAQIENAAEIGMEHHLGMTCDPIGGLVQIPCIERNSMGAIKAINAARLAMMDDGAHLVSLDAVIETMRQTGVDLQSKYKETSLGGLAVNVVAC